LGPVVKKDNDDYYGGGHDDNDNHGHEAGNRVGSTAILNMRVEFMWMLF